MELIERYLQETGRHLPANKREDILSELRSSLNDALDARVKQGKTEETVVEILEEMGAPKKVAASYHPAGQYLIGPELFPLFKLVLTIVFAASVGGQLIGGIVKFLVSYEPMLFVEQFLQIINSIPVTLGFVVTVFAILQWFDVRPELDEEAFDPRKLPALHGNEPVKRGEKIFGIIFGTLFLGIFWQIAKNGGFSSEAGLTIIANPIINQYFTWIALSFSLGILMDIVLLWRGHWELPTRIASIAVNIFSLAVLFFIIKGHNAWLANEGMSGFANLEQIFNNVSSIEQIQLIVMFNMRLGLSIAFVIVAIETVVAFVRLFRARGNNIVLPATHMMLVK